MSAVERVIADLTAEPAHSFVEVLSNEDYHGGPGLSSSNVKTIRNYSIDHYVYSKTAPPKARSAAFVVGDGVHAAVLEPDRFEAEFLVMPSFGRSKADQAAKRLWLAEHAGADVMTSDQRELILRCAEAIQRHPDAAHFVGPEAMESSKAESSFFWRDPISEIVCKCRPDVLHWSMALPDIKTTARAGGASRMGFDKVCADLGYWISGPMYSDGVSNVLGSAPSEHPMVFIVVEKEPPYAVGVHMLDEEAAQLGRQAYRDVLRLLRRWIDAGDKRWGGYPRGIDLLSLPNWVHRKEGALQAYLDTCGTTPDAAATFNPTPNDRW